MTGVAFATGVRLRIDLPDVFHDVPLSPGPESDEGIAFGLAREMHPGLFTDTGAVIPEYAHDARQVVARYAATVAIRRESGALMMALCAGEVSGEYTASLLTISAVDLAYDDPEVAVGAIREVWLAETAGDTAAEVMTVALPAGPAVSRVRRRLLVATGAAEGAEPPANALPVGTIELNLAVPDAGTLVVLELFCPTVATFEAHARLAGGVAHSIEVHRVHDASS